MAANREILGFQWHLEKDEKLENRYFASKFKRDSKALRHNVSQQYLKNGNLQKDDNITNLKTSL